MLLIALAILALVWAAVALVVVGLCVSAAAGDRALARAARPREAAKRFSTRSRIAPA
jgi:hypothetical protein